MISDDLTGDVGKPSFIHKGYCVPLVLSNGVDFCQLDFTGSMTWEENIGGYVSYWYKKGRPPVADPLGIVKLVYWYLSEKGPVQFGDFSQSFDPLTATLRTTVSTHSFSMNVQTFLTDDHTLFERFEITRCEEKNARLRLAMYFAENTYTNKPLRTLTPSAGQIQILRNNEKVPFFRYQHGGDFTGLGVSSVRILKGNPRPVSYPILPEIGPNEINAILGDLKKGDVLVRTTTLVDNIDRPDFEPAAWRINRRYRDMPWRAVRAAHESKWKKFHGASNFTCPDGDLARQFALSLTVCKSALHPAGSVVSALAIPNAHMMGTYWDSWFVHRALLAANRVEDAMRIIRFWDLCYPGAVEQARKNFSAGGARFAWTYGYDGSILDDGDEIHNNINPALNIWDQYCFTLDRSILEKRYPMMEDCVRFLIEYALKKDERGFYLKELIGIDESGKKKRNQLIVAIAALKGIEILRSASSVLGRQVSPQILDAEPAFTQVMESLRTPDGYAPYEDGQDGDWGHAVTYILRPAGRGAFRKGIAPALAGCQEAYGLNVGRASRMRCATFPWVEGIFAWSMLRNDDPRAKKYFLNMTRFTNFHGGIPEYVWLHGQASRDWYVGAHAVYVIALTEFIAQARNDELHILPLGKRALPFKTFQVENLRLQGAWLFSADLSSKGVLKMRIRNGLPRTRTIQLRLPNGKPLSLTVKAGAQASETTRV